MSFLRMILHGTAAPDRILILGTGPEAHTLAEVIRGQPGDYVFLGLVDPGGNSTASDRVLGVPDPRLIVGTLEQLPEIITHRQPDRIIIAAVADADNHISAPDIIAAQLNGVIIETASAAQHHLTGRLTAAAMKSSVFTRSSRSMSVKRVFSIIAATAGLLISAPLMIVIALLIKLDSRGPVFFVQERIGLRGRRFRLLKFRSMVPDAQRTSAWAGDNADRITGVGRWLRHYHLDELPQFINILRGDMDLVGPRPHPLSNYELFDREIPHYSLRSEIRPGLTGWAQVRNGYADDLVGEMAKMQYDLYYLMHQSLALDLWIVLETFKIVGFGRAPVNTRRPQRRTLRPSSSA